MPLQTHRNKEDKKMYKVLLETGELKEFRTLKAAIRKSVVINGKKQILYISENVGFGPDTNTLIFDNEYEYGNLTSARIKYLMNKLAFAHFYKRCAATLNWLTGACSQSDTFKCRCIARQRDMSMKQSEMRMHRVDKLEFGYFVATILIQ